MYTNDEKKKQWMKQKKEEDENDVIDPFDNDRTFFNHKGEWGHVQINPERSILKDLKPYMDIDDDVKNMADAIYNKMHYQVRRKKIRYQLLFYCTYCAYMELNLKVNPIELGAIFGLKQGAVQRCDSLFSPLQTGYTPPIKNARPTNYLERYCEKIGLSKEAGIEINKLGEYLLKKDPNFLQENPQTVAAGILKYFIVTNGISIEDPDLIKNVTNRSNATIESIYQWIVSIDNQ
jgi:transcription initiation factor TFIIIB Brf1 subunit/transcription initiation factor TFIIB